MRALVTGGAGFVGSTIVDTLVRRGDTVCVLDDLSRGSRSNLGSAGDTDLVVADVRDAVAVHDAVARCAPEVVFHLAAQIDVRSSMEDPGTDAATNVLGTINVLSAAARFEVGRVVLSSTGGAIYGDCDTIPTPEDVTTAPKSAYGLGKWAAERYAQWFTSTFDLDVITLRYGNVYGPRQDPRGDAGVIALFCEAALDDRRPIIFGDGHQTRDFVFVNDIAEANIAAGTIPAPPNRVYNIGSGHEISILDLVDAVRAVTCRTGDQWEPEFRTARAGEVRRSCLDVARARSELALPRTTPLDHGLRATLSYVRTLQSVPAFR